MNKNKNLAQCLYGIDIYPNMLEIVKQKLENYVNLVLGDTEKLSF
ncbi:TPA: SAM-dependent methyltransferase [Clostridioides difficile]|nr:SAM-dependent methyltransferase [Clostridioides difficile]EGT2201629.1 SAM-dependent methyltransferase [Clostridioides difficile]EGT4667051.1 SAM-dependent methyltransferase [Clostridioides difficile]UUC40641.1 class I SAM-dependent methyltransferase [Clostridioides difficile]HAU5069063.1 class I SAM-dependent methyltransferase [Clostridioides difficile]HAU5230752.1 class I SAM-dependent methyltransferase [Clostridioides difficile]